MMCLSALLVIVEPTMQYYSVGETMRHLSREETRNGVESTVVLGVCMGELAHGGSVQEGSAGVQAGQEAYWSLYSYPPPFVLLPF